MHHARHIDLAQNADGQHAHTRIFVQQTRHPHKQQRQVQIRFCRRIHQQPHRIAVIAVFTMPSAYRAHMLEQPRIQILTLLQSHRIATAVKQHRQHLRGILPFGSAKDLLQAAQVHLGQHLPRGTGKRGLPLQGQNFSDVGKRRRPCFVSAAVIAAVTAARMSQVLPQALHFFRQFAVDFALHQQAIPLHPQQQGYRPLRQAAHIAGDRGIGKIIQWPRKHIEHIIGHIVRQFIRLYRRTLVAQKRLDFLRTSGLNGRQLLQPHSQQGLGLLRQGGKRRFKILVL